MPRGCSCSSTTTSRIRSCCATCVGPEACSSTASETRPRPTSPPGSRSVSAPTATRSDRSSGTRQRSPPCWSALRSCSSSQGARSSASSRRADVPSASADRRACLPTSALRCRCSWSPTCCGVRPRARGTSPLDPEGRRSPAEAGSYSGRRRVGRSAGCGTWPCRCSCSHSDSPASMPVTSARRCSWSLTSRMSPSRARRGSRSGGCSSGTSSVPGWCRSWRCFRSRWAR